MDDTRSGDDEKDKVWALLRLAMDWSSYDLTIYTDGSVKDRTEMGGGGILSTNGHPSDPTNPHSYAMPTGI